MDKWRLLHDFEWHDLPVDSITVGLRAVALVVTPYSEQQERYRHLVLTLNAPGHLQLTFPPHLSRGDLGDIGVHSFDISASNSDRLFGKLTLLAGNVGVIAIEFEDAEWSLLEDREVPMTPSIADARTAASVWVFTGPNAAFPSGVFSTRELADAWISSRRLTGTLTEYPLDEASYDWAIRGGYFTPSREAHRTAAFISRFTSGVQQHFHYENGRHLGTLPAAAPVAE